MPTLDWLNRDAAFRTAAEVPYRMLELVSEHRSEKPEQLSSESPNVSGQGSDKDRFSKNNKHSDQAQLDWASDEIANKENQSLATPAPAAASAPAPTHDNLLIQGDNLEALKALLPFYRGQVKCIFIDPPYNTKSAFEHYDDNLEHAQWLSMMLPRLQLLRELLREDGSIWVTIDDNEGHYLKVLMDEVFGRGKNKKKFFLANVVWQSKDTPGNNASGLAETHNHILCYVKNPDRFRPKMLSRNEDQIANYKNPDDDERGPWLSTPLTRAEYRERDYYALTNPVGNEVFPPKGSSWRRPPKKMIELAKDNRIWWGKNGDAEFPMEKKFLTEVKEGVVNQTWWPYEFAGSTRNASAELKALFDGEKVFDTPKPERLLHRILNLATDPNDLILDSFLGSGATAAVAQKMCRRWIGIEMGEHAKTHCVPRLQKVIDGEQGGISKAVNWQGGGSFRFMKLGATIFDETGAINPEVRFATLASFIWMQETGTPLAKKKTGASPFLGTYNGVDYFLLFNGILGDKRPHAGNVLTRVVLQELMTRYPNDARPRVIYGESNRLGDERLKEALVQFKTLPHEVVKR